uniref:Taurine catabolism dioxygenase TauD, TfdA family n=1 Tax=Candidatus Kentrum sp. FM TaxID=2126340 RepID=A0A450TDQ0_9GAMM|nr:MAG: Taurine catabolism dioxygenase TauD, TfdA family [Candidatus Kentron sp. FM]VFJ67268.1 MAG: Taurine catabolism dioxygenase TauD, TfdA family [Candidatus Kentron sp. FM]VFK11850.1 MAG: Taurine catabolism dioxygenase TauD, TfdA family [Candidatus Kentron sp. FM]
MDHTPTDPTAPSAGTAFDIGQDGAYRAWRDAKLAGYPARVEELCVAVRDPRQLSDAEYGALVERCRKTNIAIYQSAIGRDPDRNVPALLGKRFGLERIDRNQGSDDDAITSITVTEADGRGEFIPYTDRPLQWHTDGYYNAPDRQIRGFLLHCVNPARSGGENALLDHEIAYILLREENPAFISALMAPDALTIPAYIADGVLRRPERSGPVFSVGTDGTLHMRYTMRTRNIHWKQDPVLKSALAFLERLFSSDSPYIFRAVLQPGWGVLNNNVLHDRSSFVDSEQNPRLLYRARYYDRIADTA